jgi:thiol:disulfide interchange protein DsbC
MMRAIVAALFLGIAAASHADEAAVRRMLEDTLGAGAAIESIRKAPWGDLYEVVVRGTQGPPEIYYVDGAASVILTGQAIDAKTGRNLTEERQRKLGAIKWSSLPFDDAVTTKRGTGRRKIAVFSDPNCPFCKRFEKDLAKLGDITAHVFLYPVIKPQSVAESKAVWCSKDRARAWHDLMLRGIQPAAKPDCDTPVEKLVALGHKLGANSTPTWFLENGERHSGALPLEEVRRLLDEASPPAGGRKQTK